MILVLLYLAVLVAGLMPETAVGRALRRVMIDLQNAVIARFTPGKLLLIVCFALIVAAVIAIARADVMLLVAQGLPEAIGWFFTFDVVTYLDVMALAWLLAATVRLRAVAQPLSPWVARVRRGVAVMRLSSRSRRARRLVRKPAPKSSDDDGGWAGPFAYA